jgi:hypothetical protein
VAAADVVETVPPDFRNHLGAAELAAITPATANPIQRATRDITVATGHVLHDRTAAMELPGRLLLGMERSATIY